MNTSEKPETAQLEAVREPPSAQNGYHIDPVIEKRLVRKLDKHLVPLVVLLCKLHLKSLVASLLIYTDLLSYLDRSNIGYVSVTDKSVKFLTSNQQCENCRHDKRPRDF